METINIVFTSLLCAGMVILAGCAGSGSASPSASDPVVSDDNTSITTSAGSAFLDQDTELQTGVQGFTIKNIYIVDGDDKKISSREIAFNTTFSIVYEGVSNYTLKENMAFPDLSIQIFDDEQKTIMSETDQIGRASCRERV